jgi:hypothetical protein
MKLPSQTLKTSGERSSYLLFDIRIRKDPLKKAGQRVFCITFSPNPSYATGSETHRRDPVLKT